MSFLSTPKQSGIYRIKALAEDLYLESVPEGQSTAYTPWMRLVAGKSDDKRQQWSLTKSTKNPSEWFIASNFDQAGLVYKKTSETYRGHGYPYPFGQSIVWSIIESNGQYSKICTPVNGSDVFDSQYRNQGDDAVHFWKKLNRFDGPYQCFVFELLSEPNPPPPPPPPKSTQIDVVIIQDATGSQGPYIAAARDQIKLIVANIRKAFSFQNEDDLRLRLVAFRDHPPQDTTFVIQSYDFTSDVGRLQSELEALRATGGGDGPEAQTDALDSALNSAWRDNAVKIVILVTDSPPHGVEDVGDSFPDGCLNQLDPVRTVKLFADRGITLHVIACEPTLSGYYDRAHDFYKGLVERTPGGSIIPLGKNLITVVGGTIPLEQAVTGLVVKTASLARVATIAFSKVRDQANAPAARPGVARGAQSGIDPKANTDKIVEELYADLTANEEQVYQVGTTTNVYVPNAIGERNAAVWKEAASLKEAKKLLEKVTAGSRLVEDYGGGEDIGIGYTKQPITKEQVDSIVSRAIEQGKKSAI